MDGRRTQRTVATGEGRLSGGLQNRSLRPAKTDRGTEFARHSPAPNLLSPLTRAHTRTRTRNRNRKLQTSKAPLKSQAQGTSLFTSAASNQRGFPKNSP